MVRSGFREVVYRLTLLPGAEPTALPLALAKGAPTLTAETRVAHLDETGHVWRIVHVYGSETDLAKARVAFHKFAPAFLVEKRIMGEARRRLVLWYKYRSDLGAQGRSVTALAFQYLGRETVVTDSSRDGELTVRLLCRSNSRTAAFLARVRKEIAKTYRFDLIYAGPPRHETASALTPDEERVLRTAHALGYFGVPRKVGVREVGRGLGVSASAASARLRRAEAKLVRSFVGDS